MFVFRSFIIFPLTFRCKFLHWDGWVEGCLHLKTSAPSSMFPGSSLSSDSWDLLWHCIYLKKKQKHCPSLCKNIGLCKTFTSLKSTWNFCFSHLSISLRVLSLIIFIRKVFFCYIAQVSTFCTYSSFLCRLFLAFKFCLQLFSVSGSSRLLSGRFLSCFLLKFLKSSITGWKKPVKCLE